MPADGPQLDHVDSCFTAFALADKRLGLSKATSEFHLRHARGLSSLAEQAEKRGVFVRVDGLFHAPS